MLALHRAWEDDGGIWSCVREAEKKLEMAAPTAEAIALENVHFGYAITGATPPWRPVRAFDDGARVYIEFPKDLSTTEAPPLFVVGKGGQAQLVNYRVHRNYYIVDGLFDVAELRLGEKPQAIVRITADRKGGKRHD
jgi:type IV secretion system protein VirB9